MDRIAIVGAAWSAAPGPSCSRAPGTCRGVRQRRHALAASLRASTPRSPSSPVSGCSTNRPRGARPDHPGGHARRCAARRALCPGERAGDARGQAGDLRRDGRARGADCILASSTSYIPASAFSADLPGRARCLVAHPVTRRTWCRRRAVPAPWTAPDVVERARRLHEVAKQVPVVVRREIPASSSTGCSRARVRGHRLYEDGYARRRTSTRRSATASACAGPSWAPWKRSISTRRGSGRLRAALRGHHGGVGPRAGAARVEHGALARLEAERRAAIPPTDLPSAPRGATGGSWRWWLTSGRPTSATRRSEPAGVPMSAKQNKVIITAPSPARFTPDDVAAPADHADEIAEGAIGRRARARQSCTCTRACRAMAARRRIPRCSSSSCRRSSRNRRRHQPHDRRRTDNDGESACSPRCSSSRRSPRSTWAR